MLHGTTQSTREGGSMQQRYLLANNLDGGRAATLRFGGHCVRTLFVLYYSCHLSPTRQQKKKTIIQRRPPRFLRAANQHKPCFRKGAQTLHLILYMPGGIKCRNGCLVSERYRQPLYYERAIQQTLAELKYAAVRTSVQARPPPPPPPTANSST